jgi:SWI/SNF-related matrix-associated actin-dependent regulator of chromatin subfamily A member 5
VIVPKSTLGNWCNEFRRWCPSLRVVKFHGNAEERAAQRAGLQPHAFDVCATTYEMIIKEKNLLKRFRWRYIIIDEAHRMKNENSVLATVLRSFSCNNRLLITGTPLQNNLHELWALLNFLLPEVFADSSKFDEWFAAAGDGTSAPEGKQKEVVAQLHKVLRPFLLRRLKADVEKGLPPKKETILKVGLSDMQAKFYSQLQHQNLDTLLSGVGDRGRLMNLVMQLRKCCNHPYLFQGAEPGPPYVTGEHLVDNAGKMILLDRLLPRLRSRDSRVLIFSQMTRMLDILEDYMHYRGYQYCRIDGNTQGDDREAAIEAFNAPDSTKFCFLLSTRAGGLGINLATADTVVLYDSDWNPQMDLQAMDRAHRIGQKKEVQVFRFMTDNSVEVKVIEKAYKKLALDALVIQSGRLQEAKAAVGKDELLQMARYGAEKMFSTSGAEVTDMDIDSILAKGEEATRILSEKMAVFKDAAMKFSLEGDKTLYDFEGQAEAPPLLGEPGDGDPTGGDLRKLAAQNWVEPGGRRDKKRGTYNENEYFRDRLQQAPRVARPVGPKLPVLPKLHDFQFFNTPRIQQIQDKEEARLKWAWTREQQAKEAGVELAALQPDPEEPPEPSTAELEERALLLTQGFGSWTKRDLTAFLKAAERFGREDLGSIAKEVDGKSLEEVVAYSAVFWARVGSLADGERYVKAVERGEQKIQRQKDISAAVTRKLEQYGQPGRELRVVYGTHKGKAYTEEEDRFLLCALPTVGFGNWDDLKARIRTHWLFRFDWFFKSRTPAELGRRVETLVRLVERELEESDIADAIKAGRPPPPRRVTAPQDGGEGGAGKRGRGAGAADGPPSKKGRKAAAASPDAMQS